MTNLKQKQNGWLEPMKEWIKVASSLEKTARDSNLFSKKVAAKEIFGSNLLLQNKLVRASAPNSSELAGGNQWDALRASHQKVGLLSETRILEPTRGIEPRTYSFTYTSFLSI